MQQLVAQAGSLLFRRMAFGQARPWTMRQEQFNACGLPIRDTAECHSALRWQCQVAPVNLQLGIFDSTSNCSRIKFQLPYLPPIQIGELFF